MSLLDLGLLCLRLGFLSFGGGVSTLAEMQHVVVDVHGAMTQQEFAYAFGLGQATPGPGILYLVPLGMKIGGPAGAFVATTCFVLPPLLLLGILIRAWQQMAGSRWAASANRTLAPMSLGLMAAALRTVAAPIVGDPPAIAGVVVATIVIFVLRVSPPLVVLLTGVVWMLGSG
jgi:chromate transporter